MANYNFKKMRKHLKKPRKGAYGTYSDISSSSKILKKSISSRIINRDNKGPVFHATVKNNGISYGEEASHVSSKGADLYNELSFNVLENAAENTSKKTGSSKNFKAVVSSKEVLDDKQGSLTETFGTKGSVYTGQGTGKFRLHIVICILVAVVVFGVLGCLVYSGVFGRVYENRSPIKFVCSQVANVDKHLIKLNELLATELNTSSVDELEDMKQDLKETQSELERLEARTQQIMNEAEAGSDDSNYAPEALTAIRARQKMITSGTEILELANSTVQNIEKIDTFWDESIEGNNLLCQVDEILNENDSSKITTASTLSEQSIDCFKYALDELNEINADAIDVDQYKNYLNTAIKCANASLLTCQAMSTEDVDAATSANQQYLEFKSNLADMANSLDKMPAQVLRTSYNLKAQQTIETYKQARNSAAVADTSIKKYLNK